MLQYGYLPLLQITTLMLEGQRTKVLSELAKFTGRQVSWRFIKQTSDYIQGIDRFHNLVTGIFKPAWSQYALSIAMSLKSPYEKKDEVIYLEDGRWLMTYSSRSVEQTSNRNRALSDNDALVRCMKDRVPIAVFKQLTDKTDRQQSSTYLVLGLAIITGYDPKLDVFVVEGADNRAVDEIISYIKEEETRYEVQLYTQLSNDFRPFANEDPVLRRVSVPKRRKAFRHIVLTEYDFTCAVCEMKFHLGDLFEANAAHIISKQRKGSDDPRNGITLCRTHHWAFDNGIFAIDGDYRIVLSPVIDRADMGHFELKDFGGKEVLLPRNSALNPHPVALSWHRENVFLNRDG